MFRRVLVTRNVGCRNGIRGILATGFERGREAERGHGAERRTRSMARTGPVVIVLAARVLRASKGRKTGERPSVVVSGDHVWPIIEPKSNPWKARGGSCLRALTPFAGTESLVSRPRHDSPGG